MPPFLLLLFEALLLPLSWAVSAGVVAGASRASPAPPAPTAEGKSLLDSRPWDRGQLAFSAALPVALASSSCVRPGSLSTGNEKRTAPSASTARTARSSGPEAGSKSLNSALAAASPSLPGRQPGPASRSRRSRRPRGARSGSRPRRSRGGCRWGGSVGFFVCCCCCCC